MKAITIISFFWQHAKRFKWLAAGVLIMPPLAVLVHTFLSSLIVATILDKLARGDYSQDFFASFGGLTFLYIATYLVGNVLLYRLVTYLSWRLDILVTKAIHQQMFSHLVTLDTTFHSNHFGGTLVAQAHKLSSAYERFSEVTVTSLLPLVSVVLFTIFILLPRAPLYLPILLLLALSYLAVAVVSAKRIRHFYTSYAQQNSQQAGFLADTITNIFTVKSFARDRYEQKHYAKATDKTYAAGMKLLGAMLRRDTQFSLVGSSFSIAAVVMVIVSVMYLHTSIGTAFLMLTYSLAIAQRLWDFSSKGLRGYNQAFGDAHDMLAILQTPPTIVDTAKPQKITTSQIGINFKNIDFTHTEVNKALFHQFSLTIKPGEKVGLVGHSGAGKSTLTRLLLRFIEPESGEILLDTHPITSLRQEDLRHNIAYVPQEPLLFHRSIKENIGYGKPSASDTEIRKAAKQANALEFIDELPHKMDTLVGERGIKLSGGQRQRIAIARAILKDAPILILDEATAALDSESEKLIQASLDNLMKNRTSLVIAHRLSTIAKLDRIVVLKKGAIVEDGTHAELLKKKGVYASLWNHQSGGFINE